MEENVYISKIVSGGQTGADRAALDYAIAIGIPHGGWCPKGRKAEDGPIGPPYALVETPRADYLQRTEWNVRDTDGTVIFTLTANEELNSTTPQAFAHALFSFFIFIWKATPVKLFAIGRRQPVFFRCLGSVIYDMLRKIVSKIYRRLPVIRELCELHNSVISLRRLVNDLKVSQMIRLLDFDLNDHPRYGDLRRLLRYQSQVCSQNGEDGIIHEIFRRIGTTTRVFAEVGVGDGCENNTAFLLSQGWTGFWIDGDSRFLGVLKNREDLQNDCIKYLVAFVSKENIAALFEQLGVPKEFDLMSLDIDQNTYYGWEALRSFRPRVVVVEYNAAIPPDIDWKVLYSSNRTWNETQNFGASLKAFEILGRQFGYSLVGCEFVGANAFFVRDDCLAGKFAEPFTSENHYEPPRYSMCHRRCHPSTVLDRTSRC